MGALLVYDALTSGVYVSPRSRALSYVSNSNFSQAKANWSSNNSLSTNPDTEKQLDTSPLNKPRRISSHIPPHRSNLVTSRSLRLSLSSGNIRDHINPETDDVIAGARDHESALMSPRQKKVSKMQKFSFETTSLSIESVDRIIFNFDVSKFFAFGSPIGLVIAFRRLRGDERCCKYGNNYSNINNNNIIMMMIMIMIMIMMMVMMMVMMMIM